MTCIVGITDGKNVFVGGDSAGVENLNLTVRADDKVFIRTDESGVEWAFGFTTSFRMGQLIQYDLVLPQIEDVDRGNLHQFMVSKFIPALRTCLKIGGWQAKEKHREEGGTFIVGVLGELFVVGDDYQVGKPKMPYAAVGSGTNVALGALYALSGSEQTPEQTPEQKITVALEAAEAFNAGVRGPFKIVSTKAE